MSFYSRDDKHKRFYINTAGTRDEEEVSPASIDLERVKVNGGVVKQNASASLVDIGDDILCLEFHSKMNAIGPDIISMMRTAVSETEKNPLDAILNHKEWSFLSSIPQYF